MDAERGWYESHVRPLPQGAGTPWADGISEQNQCNMRHRKGATEGFQPRGYCSTESSDGRYFCGCHMTTGCHVATGLQGLCPTASPAPKQQLPALCTREPGMRLMSWAAAGPSVGVVMGICGSQLSSWEAACVVSMLLGSQWHLQDPQRSRPKA